MSCCSSCHHLSLANYWFLLGVRRLTHVWFDGMAFPCKSKGLIAYIMSPCETVRPRLVGALGCRSPWGDGYTGSELLSSCGPPAGAALRAALSEPVREPPELAGCLSMRPKAGSGWLRRRSERLLGLAFQEQSCEECPEVLVKCKKSCGRPAPWC